jgi:hypothetical protein
MRFILESFIQISSRLPALKFSQLTLCHRRARSTMNIVLLKFFIILSILHRNYAIFKISNGASENNNNFKTFNDYRANMQLHTVKIFSRDDVTTLKGYSCSGSIIDFYWIITSAHCVYGFDIIDVFIGEYESHTFIVFIFSFCSRFVLCCCSAHTCVFLSLALATLLMSHVLFRQCDQRSRPHRESFKRFHTSRL